MFFASLIYAFARFLYGQQATTEVRSADLVGRDGAWWWWRFRRKASGQVRCQIGEELIDQDGADPATAPPLAENSIVTVEEVLGEICHRPAAIDHLTEDLHVH